MCNQHKTVMSFNPSEQVELILLGQRSLKPQTAATSVSADRDQGSVHHHLSDTVPALNLSSGIWCSEVLPGPTQMQPASGDGFHDDLSEVWGQSGAISEGQHVRKGG